MKNNTPIRKAYHWAYKLKGSDKWYTDSVVIDCKKTDGTDVTEKDVLLKVYDNKAIEKVRMLHVKTYYKEGVVR